MGELKKAFHVRHPGEGRDPVCKMFVEETKKNLDPGLRRDDETKENEFNLRF